MTSVDRAAPARGGFVGSLVARARGEVAADALEAYRRAGASVWTTLQELDARHHERPEAERSPWSADPGAQAERLCAWNAFCLQTIGDCLVDADYRADPASAGFVPAALAEHALLFYSQVEGWVSRAYQARCNPTYALDVAVPAQLPPWPDDGFDTETHSIGLLDAIRRVQDRADVMVEAAMGEPVSAEHGSQVGRIKEVAGEANGKSEYASGLWSPGVPARVRGAVLRCACEALEQYYLLGQLVAMPQLAAQRPPSGRRDAEPATDVATAADVLIDPAATGPHRPRRLPSATAVMDPWRLADPDARIRLRSIPAARKAMATLWAYDPNPRVTLELQEAIEAALARGDLDYATDAAGTRLGCYYTCPWGSIYVVKKPVTLGRRRLRAMQQFTLEIVAGNVRPGGHFRRRLLVDTFHETTNIRYSANEAAEAETVSTEGGPNERD